MIPALLFLRLVSLRNLVVHRVSRLRQPKYLLGAAAAAAYFYYFVFRHLHASSVGAYGPAANGGAPASFAADIACTVLCGIALLRIAYTWVAPVDNPGLAFSEAEIAFLFPAPLTRRSLIHFRILSSQFAILFSAVIITVVFNRGSYLGGHKALRAIGWWVILSVVDLHLNGTRLTIAKLKQRGASMLLWRSVAVAVIIAYAAAIIWAATGPAFAFQAQKGAFADAARLLDDMKSSAAFSILTLPFRVAVGPYFASDYHDFATAMAPALLLIAVHYFWVVNTEARFEEGSIAMAERRAAQRAAMGRGESPVSRSKPKPVPGPFPLAATGIPEMAFLWKNVLSLRSSMFSRRTLIGLVAFAVWGCFVLRPLVAGHAGHAGRAGAMGLLVLIACAIVAGYTVILGPQLARQDLRNDLPNVDVLKTYPLEGWRLALGELLAPTAMLTSVLWVTVIAALSLVDASGGLDWLTPGVRLAAAACLCVTAPFLCLIQLIVPNTAMVLMPAWYQASRNRTAGIEMFGQRLVFGIMQLLFAAFTLLPAAGYAGLVYFCSFTELGIITALFL
ncbi:MAG TPA: putative ABC exporter domain-containing protein, partial [Opitutaceae bacterium]